jgi:flagellin-like hook-associated protein FlgL
MLVPLVGAVAAGAALLLTPAARSAREGENKEANKSATAAQLPVSQVVLFSSGVGYFQREGTVDGSQRIDLTFPVQDVNDLLKSMTLRDLDGGVITAVSFDSNTPVERTLQSFAINLSSNPTFGQILNQARGEKVEVVLQQGNVAQPGTMTGTIVGIEKKKVGQDKTATEIECLNLWCADGMRSLKLTEVQRVRFLNAVVESEFRKALETLAQGHDTQRKTVSIQFAGQGKRNVKVGYVIENPVWKTSYRLVLPPTKVDDKAKEAKAKKPYLQAWAIVENTTEEDWSGVKMALISGRPISFQMNLYDSLFIKRPVVEPELFASLRPPTYTGGMGDLKGGGGLGGGGFAGGGAPGGGPGFAPPPQAPMPAGGGYGFGLAGRPGGAGKEAKDRSGLRSEDASLNLAQGVASAASASKLGDYFQYAIDHAVTLPRQKSALLPIAGTDVEGQRVSIYNERTHAKFPLLGMVFKNTTGMNLTQGPVTVYEGSTYAGDARIPDLQKDERRLLSYAVDLGTEVMAVPHSDNGTLTAVKVVKGIVYTTTKIKDSKDYTIANRSDTERVVLIEHPNRQDFKLTSQDKPWETASDVHRFKVTAPAGKSTKYTVSEERDVNSNVALTNSDDQSIRIFLSGTVASPKVKAALQEALGFRGKLAATQRELQQVERRLQVITQDQDRLRKNIKELPPEAAAYKRYLKKFDDQETEIEKIQAEQKQLQETEHAQRNAYDSFLANLNVE